MSSTEDLESMKDVAGCGLLVALALASMVIGLILGFVLGRIL